MSPDVERLIGRALMDNNFRHQLLKNPKEALKLATDLHLSSDEIKKVEIAVTETNTEMNSDQIDKMVVQLVDSRW